MDGYQSYKRTSVQTADRLKLVVMLYEKTISNLNRIIMELEGEKPKKDWEALIKNSLDIIQFLSNSLDHEQGGEIAANLSGLYDYLRDIITLGNISRDVEMFQEAHGLLTRLLEGWHGISTDNVDPQAAPTPTQPVPQTQAKKETPEKSNSEAPKKIGQPNMVSMTG